jgi:hypothetical protein
MDVWLTLQEVDMSKAAFSGILENKRSLKRKLFSTATATIVLYKTVGPGTYYTDYLTNRVAYIL